MTSQSNLLPTLHRLYDAATDGKKWHAFLEELTKCFSADGAHIVRVHPREYALSFSALYGFDEAVMRLYGKGEHRLPEAIGRFEAHFTALMPTDPRIRFLEQYPSRPLSCRLHLSEADLHASAVYQDMLRPAGVEYSLCVSVPEEDGSLVMFGVFRGRQSSHFTEEEAELFGELIPHVKQAINVSEHLAHADFTSRMGLQALDTVSIAIFILDENIRVIHANATARRLAEAGDGLSIRSGLMKLHASEADAALRKAVRDTVSKVRAEGTPPGEAIAAIRPSGLQAFPLIVGGLWGDHLHSGPGRLDRPLAVVFTTDPEEPQEAPAELLRRLFGLTLAEARICERLVRGETLEEIAAILGTTVGTSRVHLKNVFAKTGVSRQTELVAKILATPVWIRFCQATRHASIAP